MAGIKINDGENIRTMGLDMGGYRIAFIGRKSFHLEGNCFDASAASAPEGDVNTFQCPNASFRPTLAIQLASYGPSKGTRLSHMTVLNGSTSNASTVTRIKRLDATNFEIILDRAFPEPMPDGQAPAEIITWDVAGAGGVIQDLQGWNWTWAVTPTSDPLRYLATLSSLGNERWLDGFVPAIGTQGTGGKAVLSSVEQGEHADGIYQFNDGYAPARVRIDRVDASGAYQIWGNTGTPPAGYDGGPILITRTSGLQVKLPPQQPAVYGLYTKGSVTVTFGYGVTMLALNARPISAMAVYPSLGSPTYDTSGAYPVVTFDPATRITGSITERLPATPNAPANVVGTNYALKGQAGHIGWIGYVAPTADMLQDITVSSLAVAAGAPVGTLIGIVRVVTNKAGEIVDTTITGSPAIVGKTRKRLVLAGVPSAGSYPIRITATVRGTGLSIYRDFIVTVQ